MGLRRLAIGVAALLVLGAGSVALAPGAGAVGTVSVHGTLQAGDPDFGDGSLYDPYTLTVGTDGLYTIDMTSTDLDPYLALNSMPFNPADTTAGRLAENDDGGGFPNARITAILSAGAPYCVLADSFGSGETGAYDLAVSGDGAISLSPGCTPPAGTLPVCTVVKTDWRAPNKDGSCPAGETLHQIASTDTGGLVVCTKPKTDWRAPDKNGCPVGFETHRAVTTSSGGLPVCVKVDEDWRDPYKDGTCPSGMTLYRVVEGASAAPST